MGLSSSPSKFKNCHFSMSSIPAPGCTQTPIKSVAGAISLRVKRKGREADHSQRGSIHPLPHTSSWRSA
jgi:hypothetical protein